MLKIFADVLDYIHQLYTKLQGYLEKDETPILPDKAVPTMASKGPAYSSLEEVAEQQEERRRGLVTKPHWITSEQVDLALCRAKRGKKQ